QRAALIAGRVIDPTILIKLADTVQVLTPQTKVLRVEWVEGPAHCTKCGAEVLDHPAAKARHTYAETPKPEHVANPVPVATGALPPPKPSPALPARSHCQLSRRNVSWW